MKETHPHGLVQRATGQQRRAPASLVRLARKAAKAAREAGDAERAWAAAFEAEYGHTDISDVLVDAIDCGGDPDAITAEFIAANAAPGHS